MYVCDTFHGIEVSQCSCKYLSSKVTVQGWLPTGSQCVLLLWLAFKSSTRPLSLGSFRAHIVASTHIIMCTACSVYFPPKSRVKCYVRFKKKLQGYSENFLMVSTTFIGCWLFVLLWYMVQVA